jgi:hypothetical protein
MVYLVIFTWYRCGVLDVFSDVYVIYMRCSIMSSVMFYGVFRDVLFSTHVMIYSII